MKDMSQFSPDYLLSPPRSSERFQRNCSRSFDGIHKHRPQVQDDIWIHRCEPRIHGKDARINGMRRSSDPAQVLAQAGMLLQPNNNRNIIDLQQLHIPSTHKRYKPKVDNNHVINGAELKKKIIPSRKFELDFLSGENNRKLQRHVIFSQNHKDNDNVERTFHDSKWKMFKTLNTTRPQNDFGSKADNDEVSNKKLEGEKNINPKNSSSLLMDDVYSIGGSSSDSESEGSYSWDIAATLPRERISVHESFQGFLKVLRVFMYILIMCLIWILSSANLASVLMLEAAIKKGGIYKQVARFQLLWIICIPYLISFLMSIFQTLFGNHQWPSVKLFFWMLLVESLHVFGLVLLVFHVLPVFGSFFNIGLMCCVGLVPALFKLFFQKLDTGKASIAWNVFIKTIDLVVLIVFVTSIGLPLLAKYLQLGNLREHSGSSSAINLWWQIILALILVSFKWWENFVGTDRGVLTIWKLKQAVHDTRVAFSLLSNIWSIGLTIALAHLLEYTTGQKHNWNRIMVPQTLSQYHMGNISDTNEDQTEIKTQYHMDNIFDIDEVNNTSSSSTEQYILSYTPGVVVVASSVIVYYLSLLATKLWMQKFSFAFPLVCSVPTVFTIISLQCWDILSELPMLANLQFQFECDIDISNHGYYTWMTIILWISFLYLTNHVWYPQIERLSCMERIFVTRMFTGPLLIQDLLLNRRNDYIDEKLFGGVKHNAELEQIYKEVNGNRNNMKHTQGKNPKEPEKQQNKRPVPMIYACATVWHETSIEMVQLLKSIYRMDADQCSHFIAHKRLYMEDPDYYEFEAHVFFDDAMDLDDSDKWVVNDFVIRLKDSLREADNSITREDAELPPPIRIPTPYGGRLVWRLPGGNNLIVHLKDKNKIKHRKRWSQVMYMYYLLGYKIFDEVPEELETKFQKSMTMTKNKIEENSASSSGVKSSGNNHRRSSDSPNRFSQRHMSTWVKQMKKDSEPNQFMKSEIFQNMEESVLQQTENTFILALDGDVDFKPDAVRLLLDRMRVNPKTAAVSGRIHPIGSGPIVWYQKFEYAIGHWLVKATEHVLGCVLCAPGCFTLLRGSALLDDNVMKTYTTESIEPLHFLQYDQGEDRWLSTLLLQQGYRIDYTAAADALTYAPEKFDEFFNQRRRWIPSTIVNIMDLLTNSTSTIMANPNISYLYILYQFLLITSTILGPSIIVLSIASAIRTSFNLSVIEAYIISVIPVVGYIILCFYANTKYQLLTGQLLSIVYAIIMIVVLVGIIQTIVTDYLLNPSLLFIVIVSGCFVFAGIIHLYEFTTLVHGVLFYLCVPAGYLVLTIYSICNMHIVSWGTRELPKHNFKSQAASEANKIKEEQKKLSKSLFSWLRLDIYLESLKEIIIQIFKATNKETHTDKTQTEMLKQIKGVRKDLKRMVKYSFNPKQPVCASESDDDSLTESKDNADNITKAEIPAQDNIQLKKVEQGIIEDPVMKVDDPKDPNWIKDKRLGNGPTMLLSKDELKFWHRLIKKYLKPLTKDPAKEKQLAASMMQLRNNANFAFWFINVLWVVFNFMIQRNANLNSIKVGNIETNPLGFVFLVLFFAILFLQMVGMIIHRWGTFLQLISITEIGNGIWKKYGIHPDNSISPKDVVKVINECTRNNGVFKNDNLYDSTNQMESIYQEINPEKVIETSKHFLKKHRRPHWSKETHVDIERFTNDSLHNPISIDHLITQRQNERHIKYKEDIQSRHNIRRNFERHIFKTETMHRRQQNSHVHHMRERPVILDAQIRDYSRKADLQHQGHPRRRLARIHGVDPHTGYRDPRHDADMEIRFRQNMKYLIDHGY